MRTRNAAVLALFTGLVLAGCGGGSSPRQPAAERDGGTIRMTMANVGSLDPARATTAQDTELDWVLYTGLLTYRHAPGAAGTALIPGVAAALPLVSGAGRVYTFTLRNGLQFWNGQALEASDVVATIDRAILTRDSPVRPLLLPVLDGAGAFAAGRARTISGVAGNDATGRVTIRLSRPDPGFESLLAEPALGIVPVRTRLHDRPGHPPPGIGPYRLQAVRPGRSFTLARNPYWTGLPGIPAGQVNVAVTISSDPSAATLAVVNDVLDVADPAQPIPEQTLDGLRRQGLGREREVTGGRPVDYLFLDTHTAPFDSRLAREAVVEGLGAQTLASAGTRTVEAACDVVPAVADAAVPGGCAPPVLESGALASARVLVARSGTVGDAVTVWSPRTGAEHASSLAEAAVLRTIGYSARVVTVPEATYRSQVTTLAPRPVFAKPDHAAKGRASSVRPVIARHPSVSSEGPEPVSADGVLEGRIVSSVKVSPVGAVPVAVGPDVSLRHARRIHEAVFGEQMIPELMSWQMDEGAAIIDPVEGLDFTSLQLR